MNKHELIQMAILLISWVVGAGAYYLYLMNNNAETKFKNVKNSFMLSAVFGVAGAFAGAKANISFWLVWVAFAVVGAIVTNQMLKKKDKPIPGVYGKSSEMMESNKEEILIGLRNCLLMLAIFLGMYFIGTSKAAWLLFAYSPMTCGAAAWFYTKNLSAVLRWSIIGLIAGVGFFIAI